MLGGTRKAFYRHPGSASMGLLEKKNCGAERSLEMSLPECFIQFCIMGHTDVRGIFLTPLELRGVLCA